MIHWTVEYLRKLDSFSGFCFVLFLFFLLFFGLCVYVFKMDSDVIFLSSFLEYQQNFIEKMMGADTNIKRSEK